MSFLMRRKKVFLFVFLVVLFFGFFNFDKAFAEVSFGGDGYTKTAYDKDGDGKIDEGLDKNNDGKVDPDEEARLKEELKNEPTLVSRITTGIISGSINMLSPFINWIAWFTAWVASIFVNIGVELLKISIDIGITNLSKILSDDGVRSLWEIFRNIGNIALVFILLYIAITTVLQISSGTGKLLGKVIAAAVLMNFSFFFGAIVVDVSNVFSLNIYDQIVNNEKVKEAGSLGDYIDEKASSGIVAEALGIKGTGENEGGVTEPTTTKGETFSSSHLKKAIGYVMLTILEVVLAIVLIIAAFTIIGRMVAIILLLLVSPVAFIGMILPATKTWSSDWWKSLIGQSFYLPVFLLFMYVGVKAIEVISEKPLETQVITDIKDLTQTIAVIAPIITQFAIVIGIFIAALIAANKISSQGSAVVNKIAGTIKSKVAGATIGGAALLGRNTVGKVAKNISENDRFQQWAANKGVLGNLSMRAMKGASGSSFDLRGTKTFSGVASATGVGDKVFGGPGGKGGYQAQFDRAVKRRTSLGESFSNDLTDSQKAEQVLAKKQMQDLLDKDVARSAHTQQLERHQQALDVAEKSGNLAEVKRLKGEIKWSQEQIKKQEDRIKGTNAYKDLENKHDSIKSARATYAEGLKNPTVPFTNIRLPNNKWIPFTGIGKAAADKVLKGKNENEKLADIVKKMFEEEEKKKPKTP